jgi:hypothetical protein
MHMFYWHPALESEVLQVWSLRVRTASNLVKYRSPSGKLSQNYGKSPMVNGKIHYKWAVFIPVP